MPSAGIVTLTGYGNFGNRLQNYALQRILDEIGADPAVTLPSMPRGDEGWTRRQRRMFLLRTEGLGGVATRMLTRSPIRSANSRPEVPSEYLDMGREESIRQFVKDRIRQSLSDYSEEGSTRGLALRHDVFVVGSDQVWNPVFGLRDHLRFLEFAEPHQRIAYAASLGVPVIPSHLARSYGRGIGAMASVSVREERASALVREVSGAAVPVVLDPTMLLGAREWESLALVPGSLAGGGFVAEFFLGAPGVEEMAPVARHAAATGLQRVDLKRDSREDLANMGPLEFIGAIRASDMLVTDSFHAAVFATIFEVPFLLRGRGAMNDRFDTLIRKAGLSVPMWRTLEQLRASVDVDWESVKEKLARERSSSLAFLEEALSRSSART